MRRYFKIVIWLLLLLPIFAEAVTPQVYPIHNAITNTRGLVAYYPGICSPGGRLLDYSGHHLDMTASQTSIAAGPNGPAQYFDGIDDYVSQRVYATKLGTVTASMAATVAFINDSGQDFSSYVRAGESRNILVATDGTGKKAWGYIGEQGTGETLGGELVDVWTNNAIHPFEVWTPGAGALITNAANTTAFGICYKATTATVGALYSVSRTITLNSGTAPSVVWGTTPSLNVPYLTMITLTGTQSAYKTALSAYTYIGMNNGNDVASDFGVSAFSIKQVLTPTTNGVKIYSTKTGSTQSWTYVNGSFNSNTIASYEIRRSDFQSTTESKSFFCWLKAPVQGDFSGIIGKYDYGDPNQRSWLFSSDNPPTAYGRFIASGNGAVIHKDYKTSIPIFDDTWHYIGVTYAGGAGEFKIYIDGREDTGVVKDVDTAIPGLHHNCTKFALGAMFISGAPQSLKGLIKHAAVWNRALYPAEIEKIYKEVKP